MSRACVCLVGLRCSGKTTLGRALAERLGFEFRDLDEGIAEAHGADSAGTVLRELGEPGFRALEKSVLASWGWLPEGTVLATGGGSVEDPESRKQLHSPRTFWLDAPVEVLAGRMQIDGTDRPGLTGADPVAEIRTLAERRRGFYEEVAGVRIDASVPVESLLEAVLSRL